MKTFIVVVFFILVKNEGNTDRITVHGHEIYFTVNRNE